MAGARFNSLSCLKVATLNVRGLTSHLKKQALARDLQNRQIDICAIQETKDVKGLDCFVDRTRLICFPPEIPMRGLGFGVSRRFAPFLHRTFRHQLTDRIAVAEFRLPLVRRGWFEIRAINVHAPTAPDTAKHPEERDKFYDLLGTMMDSYSNARGITILLGDFNSKVGSRREGESCLGRHTVGRRNVNGESLVSFANERKLILANTCFMQPARHITTWTGVGFQGRRIWNQIDFIVIPADHKSCLRQARAYAGIDTNTDHKLVLAKIQLRQQRILWHYAKHREAMLPFAIDNLPSKLDRFKQAVQTNLSTLLQSSVTGVRTDTDVSNKSTSPIFPTHQSTLSETSSSSSSLSKSMSPPLQQTMALCSLSTHPQPLIPDKRGRCPHFALPQIAGTYKPRACGTKKPVAAHSTISSAGGRGIEAMDKSIQTTTPTEMLQALTAALRNAATNVLGRKTPKRSQRWTDDPRIVDLSCRQKALRLKIDNEHDAQLRSTWRRQRNELLRQIHKLLFELAKSKADQIAMEIEQAPDVARCFVAAKLLRMRTASRLIVHDERGQEVAQDLEKAQIIKTHFANVLTDTNAACVQPFEGSPRPLQQPITSDELKIIITRLKNRRSPGHDEIAAEMLKATEDLVAPVLAQAYNGMFETHQMLQLGHGIIIPFPKPNKKPGPCANLRPITLLSVFRKILALVVVIRAKPRFEQKLPSAQAGARQYRSTTDGVWVKRMLIATAAHFNIDIFTLGTDIALAFDHVDRNMLLDYFKTDGWMDDDQLRLTRVLLAHTTMQVRVRRTLSDVSDTNCGTIQGDALSMLAFVGYIAGAMRDVNKALASRLPVLDLRIVLPFETAFVDDLDRHSTQSSFLEEVLDVTEQHFAQWKLVLNKTKTDRYALSTAAPCTRCPACCKRCYTAATCCDICDFWWHNACAQITQDQLDAFLQDPTQLWTCPACTIGTAVTRRGKEKWRTTKHLGTLLDTAKDVDARIQRAGHAYAELFKLWSRHDKIKQETRIRLFKAFVMPHFHYNLAAQALTNRLEMKLDIAHRKLLRRLIRMVYPNKISNEELYIKTASQPISHSAKRARWAYVGHILRRDGDHHPAAQAMRTFFRAKECCARRLDPMHTTLMDVLVKDLESTQYKHGLELKSEADLHVLRDLAQDRKAWDGFVSEVCETC